MLISKHDMDIYMDIIRYLYKSIISIKCQLPDVKFWVSDVVVGGEGLCVKLIHLPRHAGVICPVIDREGDQRLQIGHQLLRISGTEGPASEQYEVVTRVLISVSLVILYICMFCNFGMLWTK